MRIRRYFAEVFVEPEAYSLVRGLSSGDELKLKKNVSCVGVFLGEKYIGVIRGKKRPIVGALYEFESENRAFFYNMNEKEGVMLVRVIIADEPYK